MVAKEIRKTKSQVGAPKIGDTKKNQFEVAWVEEGNPLIKLSTIEDKVWPAVCVGCFLYGLLSAGDWADGKYFQPIIDGTGLFDGVAVVLFFIGIYRLYFK